MDEVWGWHSDLLQPLLLCVSQYLFADYTQTPQNRPVRPGRCALPYVACGV